MSDQEFFRLAVREFGIPAKTAEFLMRYLSRRPHTHTADQITDLDDALVDIVDDLIEDVKE